MECFLIIGIWTVHEIKVPNGHALLDLLLTTRDGTFMNCRPLDARNVLTWRSTARTWS